MLQVYLDSAENYANHRVKEYFCDLQLNNSNLA